MTELIEAYDDQAKLQSEITRLRGVLEGIAALGGNLSDERLEAIGGVNDGRSRAIMYTSARMLARTALAPYNDGGEKETP